MNGASELPLLAIRNTVLFPHMSLPLSASRSASIAAVEAALNGETKTLLVVTQKRSEQEEPGPDGLYGVGVKAVIKRLQRSNEGFQLLVQGLERVRLSELRPPPPFFKAKVTVLPVPVDTGPEIEALQRTIRDDVVRIQQLAAPQASIDVGRLLSEFSEPLDQVYLIASLLGLPVADEQRLLEAATRGEALSLMHDFLVHEIQVLDLTRQISERTQSELSQEQRELLLRRQLHTIQEELGETAEQGADARELRARLRALELPEKVRPEVDRELSRLERLSPMSPDYQTTRSYLDLVAELPWTKLTHDNLDLANARKVLDADHFDLKEVKERILEHLAVMKLNPGARSPILCFVGPPGVGKTSLGESIARSLGRKFDRMSLGGVHDEAELRGHRRTYVGALPGRILQALRRVGVRNPLIMLDEVDKVGSDYRGDPSSALLEVLDPAQNHSFQDNYLNLPFDLSKVFFITTANTLETIPGPLLDRMEVLRLSGYTDEEKLQIAKRYLLPRQLKQAGLKPESVTMPDNVILEIARAYTREAGVRDLERTIGSVIRRIAVDFAEGRTEPVTVTEALLAEMLGPERRHEGRLRKEAVPGLATGLAWTGVGGEVLYIEAARTRSTHDNLLLTGQLGNVMKESALAAYSYVSSHADWLGVPVDKFPEQGVHIHVPAGAIPKDGPSAGVAMAAALASLFAGRPTRLDTAMTGEITLTGLVLPVGGIKEKLLAAHREGIKRVLLPKDNEKEIALLPETVRSELEILPVATIDEALVEAIPGLRAPATGGKRTAA